MTEIGTIGADCQAKGHPSNCQATVPGTVVTQSSHNVTVTVGGQTRQIATVASANMNFPSHAHDYSELQGCHQNQSHTLDPDVVSSSITINGSPLYLVDNAVATDPTSGGNIDITNNNPSNNLNDL